MKRVIAGAVATVACLAVLFFPGAQTAYGQSILFDGSILPGQVDDIGFNDPDAGNQRLAEDFELDTSATATGVTFLGGYFPSSSPLADSFTLTVFGDDNGLPDPSSIVAEIDLIDVERTDTGFDVFGISLYEYTAEFPGVQLEASTPYWLMIVNDTSNDPNDDWVWAGRGGVGIFARSFDGGMTWSDTPPGSFSFQVLGTTEQTGACCLVNGSCVIVSEEECGLENGTFLGAGVSCEPNPCEPVPVEESSWGTVKMRYTRAR